MNPIELTLALIEESERYNNPVEYWKKHCVNCGVLAGEIHAKDDCPPQNYERNNPTKTNPITNPKATRGGNPMTPTEQDKELRGKLLNAHRYTSGLPFKGMPSDIEYHTQKGREQFIDMTMRLITADRKRVALEARIDEVGKLKLPKMRLDEYGYSPDENAVGFNSAIQLARNKKLQRIAELKAQQEEKR